MQAKELAYNIPNADTDATIDALTWRRVDEGFQPKPEVYSGAVKRYWQVQGVETASIAAGNWSAFGAAVSGSSKYGDGVFTERCQALFDALTSAEWLHEVAILRWSAASGTSTPSTPPPDPASSVQIRTLAEELAATDTNWAEMSQRHGNGLFMRGPPDSELESATSEAHESVRADSLARRVSAWFGAYELVLRGVGTEAVGQLRLGTEGADPQTLQHERTAVVH